MPQITESTITEIRDQFFREAQRFAELERRSGVQLVAEADGVSASFYTGERCYTMQELKFFIAELDPSDYAYDPEDQDAWKFVSEASVDREEMESGCK